MIHSDLNLLVEPMRELVAKLIAKASIEGLPVGVNETLRDDNVQAAYCAQGREPLRIVNAKRKEAGLWPISEDENKRTITDDPPRGLLTVYLERGHGNGTAVDIVPYKNNRPWWSAPDSVWLKLGQIGESVGLEWGGRWKSHDCPHFQYPRNIKLDLTKKAG